MARISGSSRDKTWETIRRTGIDLLYQHGYEKMSMRLLAGECGLQGGSLYNYFSGKADFLSMIVCEIMENLIDSITAELDKETDPVAQAARFTELMTIWHTRHRKEAFVAHMEVRNVSPERYEEYTGLRRAFSARMKQIITAGCEDGSFEVNDVAVMALAILTMLAGIPNWYRTRGRLSSEQLAAEYVVIVLRQLGVRPEVLERYRPATAAAAS